MPRLIHYWTTLLLCCAAAACSAQPETDSGPVEVLPGVTVNRDAGHVDVQTRAIGREVDWLELVACTVGSREHEALVTLDFPPSHVHAGLLALGLEPGEPQRVERVEGGFLIYPPHGPEVELRFLWADADGVQHDEPVHRWVRVRETGEPAEPAPFMFTGSAEVEYEGRMVYMADANGTLASLVQFGDEVLAQATAASNRDGSEELDTMPDRLPPPGTPVVLRITPTGGVVEPAPPISR